MSGGQQGGPMMGGSGKGGTQAPQAPQGHMIPSGQPQGIFGMPQSPQGQPRQLGGLLAKLYGG